jgi:hypothetical protein
VARLFSEELVQRVVRYSARVRDDVLAQVEQDVVWSPLAAWILLCVCLLAAEGSERDRLESIVGCSRHDARRYADTVLEYLPSALRADIAVWVNEAIATDARLRWRAESPAQIEMGPVPTRVEADAWAHRNTQGIIRSFPIAVDGLDLLVASSIATKVSWEEPYQVGDARDWFSATSPWLDVVQRVLWTTKTWTWSTLKIAAIVETRAAGLVAVHEAVAHANVTVLCVSADPAVERGSVLAGAYEVAHHFVNRSKLASLSLYDLPVGEGHSWVITEQEVPFWPGGRRETITDIALPAWEIHSQLDLMRASTSGVEAARDVLGHLAEGRRGAGTHLAVARFDRHGFEAAAPGDTLTELDDEPVGDETGMERTASLRFDHPFAAIAVIGKPEWLRPDLFPAQVRGLPVFEAWVHTPMDIASGAAEPGHRLQR